jgi:hypothetical protein
MTSVPCYVFTSGNLSTTSLTTVTFRLTHTETQTLCRYQRICRTRHDL